jgi:hypothetical protein
LVEEATAVPPSQNPLNPLKTSVHAFPVAYPPSQEMFDPFAVEPHAWLRQPRVNPQEVIDATPEAVEDMSDGFDRMEVDAPGATEAGARPPRNVASELYGVWFSSGSTLGSRPSSYASSAGSSPLYCDAELPTSSESALEADLDAPSACAIEIPGSPTSLDPEETTACDSLGDDTGRSAASLKNQAMAARVAGSRK